MRTTAMGARAMRTATSPDVRTARVALTQAAGGRCRIELSSGLLAPRVVSRYPRGAHVALVATTATLLGGDDVLLEVEVGAGLRLDLTDVAGTVAYNGRGVDARICVLLQVREGATLVWAGLPLVVSEGADVERWLPAEVAAGGRLLMRDQVALGRVGEVAGSLLCRTRLRYAGQPALVEHLDLRAAQPGAQAGPDEQGWPGDHVQAGARVRPRGALRGSAGMLGGARVIDTVTAIGWRPAPAPTAPAPTAPGTSSLFSLEAPGAVARDVVLASHQSSLPQVWSEWSRQLG